MDRSPESLFSAYPLEDYRQHQSEIDEALKKALAEGFYILGGQVTEFEKEFAAFAGTKHAIGVGNGTDSIEIILRGLDIGLGHHVALPSQTAVATAAAVARAGATPVFLDVDPQTFTVTPASLEKVLQSPVGPTLKAVIAVHLYGHPADLGTLQHLCDAHGLELIEDCAQAHGAAWQGKSVGSIGRAGSFSFYPTKNLGAIGDGGGITTNDDALAEKMRCIRQYGWRRRYISDIEGVNSRLDELQAAILRVKLRHFRKGHERRQQLAQRYAAGLSGTGVEIPAVRPECEHAYHLYVIRSSRRDALLKHLIGRHIPAALHYPAAIHQQPAYDHIRQISPALPHTDALVPEILSLPLHPYLSDEAIDHTVAAVREFAEISA